MILRHEQEIHRLEELARQKVVETKLKAKFAFVQQQQALVEQADYECRIRSEHAESALQNLRSPLNQAEKKLYGKSRKYEESIKHEHPLREELHELE